MYRNRRRNERSAARESPLILAIINNNSEEVARLIESGADIRENTNKVIKYAAERGNFEVIRALVSAGADYPEFLDRMLREVSKNRNINLDIVRYLLEQGADASDYTTMIEASIRGNIDFVRLLLENGANIHAGNEAALFEACAAGNLEFSRFLLENGANPNVLVEDDDIIEEIQNNSDLMNLLEEYGIGAAFEQRRRAALEEEEKKEQIRLAGLERRRVALEQEEKNEHLRIRALEEIKNREEKGSENSFIETHCFSTENLYGDPLKDTDNIVIFELDGNKGDCYLKEELKLLQSDQYVRGVGEKAYKLPWSNIWITKTLKNFAENMEGYGPLRLQRSENIVGYNSANILWVLVEN